METLLMPKPRCEVVFINRSFWPHSPIVGASILKLAEKMSMKSSVAVVAQVSPDFKNQLEKHNRGKQVSFNCMKRATTSKSHMIWRVIESLVFMMFVFWKLLRLRPRLVYVGTDPPVVVPFMVSIYKYFLGGKIVYHVQDIHPEATSVIFKGNRLLYKLAKILDNFTLTSSDHIMTLSSSMATVLRERTNLTAPITVINNPGLQTEVVGQAQIDGFAFCGNAGRLQLIPLIVRAVDRYLSSGGTFKFTFAGSGIFIKSIQELSLKHPNKVTYLGVISGQSAAEVIDKHKWALLPINDEVTQFAFPSKASSYVHSRAKILAVCSADTAVAEWLSNNELGLSVSPKLDSIVDIFKEIENGYIPKFKSAGSARKRLQKELNFPYFIDQIHQILKQV